MAYFDESTQRYVEGDLPPNIVAANNARETAAGPRPNTNPVTGQPVASFMNNPGVQRMLAAQAAGGTGRQVQPGGGGFGSMPMMQMLAPYLSQQRGGGMSPLLQQMLPMLMAQQQGGGMMGGAQAGMQGAQPQAPQQGFRPQGAGQITPEMAQMIMQRFGQMRA